jgi:hypothetical protein
VASDVSIYICILVCIASITSTCVPSSPAHTRAFPVVVVLPKSCSYLTGRGEKSQVEECGVELSAHFHKLINTFEK